ncbi:unnamed protein product [Albugo candida]|uniref:DNA/RNA-binding domain-containing protein n=1 Tax=Albugo candida TaxID=65357 RepID=A0A024FXT7_9STRA|nr:unnamed protein product [Albugo candida]|eukprot:CCI11464.1 unnamed protein product [Albugo candida]
MAVCTQVPLAKCRILSARQPAAYQNVILKRDGVYSVKDLKPLLEVRMIGETLLLKIVVINIFSIVKSKDTKTATDALRLSISLMTCVAEYISNEVEKLTNENFIPSLRLLGPMSVFCDYLKSNPVILDKMELIMNPESGQRDVTAGNIIKQFFETLAILINNPKLKVYDVELRGFFPLTKLYDPSSEHWKLDESSPQRDRASSPRLVAYLSDKEAFKIRAWKLCKFGNFLCVGYEGNSLLCSNNGVFLLYPSPVASNISTADSNSNEGMAPVLPANVLGIFNENSFEVFGWGCEADLEDGVIVFQPAARSSQLAPLASTGTDNEDSSRKLASFVSNDAFPDPFSSLCVGNATHSSCSTAFTSSFSRVRGGINSSGGLTSSITTTPLDNSKWGDSKRVGSLLLNDSVRDRVLNSSQTKAINTPVSDPMDDLAAIESSLNSLFNGSTGLSGLFGTIGPSASRTPRPPPGL